MKLLAGLTIGWIVSGITTGLRAQAEPSRSLPRLTGTSFAVARYKAGASASLYAASRIGPGMIVAGVVYQPRANPQTVVLGIGTRIRLNRAAAVTVILAGAGASTGRSLRLYALPRLAAGRVTVFGNAATYLPLRGNGARQAMVDPLTVSVPVVGGLSAGLSAMIATGERSRPDFGLGPSAQLRLPGGVLTVELIARTRSYQPQFRSAFSAAL